MTGRLNWAKEPQGKVVVASSSFPGVFWIHYQRTNYKTHSKKAFHKAKLILYFEVIALLLCLGIEMPYYTYSFVNQ